MRNWTICVGIGALLASAAACGGDDDNLAEPRMIAGGGLGDGAIKGRVNVYVIDSETDDPVGGATVSIGEPGEEPIEGATDSAGLFTVDDGGLDGPTTITVIANGYVAQTWFGANAVNATIPIDPINSSSSVPHAMLSGTIAGWDALPEPPTNHATLALVSYSQTRQLGDPANELVQPAGTGGLPGNACVRSSFLTQCDWDVNSRAGKIAVFAIIVDLDTKGTAGGDDDTTEVIGFAYEPGVTVEDGVNQGGLSLTQLPVGAMTEIGAVVPAAPSGLNEVGIIMGLDVGDDGIMMVGYLDDPANRMLIPALQDDFSGDYYRAYAFAGPAGDDPEDDDPMSARLLRDITDLGSDVDFGDWMALPKDVSETSGEFSFAPVAGAALHVASFRDSQGNEVWGAVLLDGRTTFSLPAITPDPLPTGQVTLLVSAFDGDVDLQDFAIDDFQELMDALSRDRGTFTH